MQIVSPPVKADPVAPLQATGRPSAERFPALDGVRGIAILAVLIVHGFLFLTPETLPSWVKSLASPFWIGVNVFFVLSGFLITGILIDTKHEPHYFKSFYMRRILRIFPLYFGVLVLSFVALPALHLVPRPSFAEQFWYWSYLSNWAAAHGHGVRSLSHFWSLAVEEQFYLVWPFAVYVVPRRFLPGLCAVSMLSSFLFRVSVFALGFPTTYAYFLSPARVEDLATGALAACIVRDPVWIGRIRRAGPFVLALCFAAFVGVCAAAHGFESTKALPVVFGTTAISLSAGLLILSAVSPIVRGGIIHTALRSALSTPVLRWLGIYSYGIYVFHLPIIVLLHNRVVLLMSRIAESARLAVSFCVIGAVLATSCGVAFISYHLFEKRFLNLKNRFQSR